MNTRHIAFRSNRVCDIIGRYHEWLDPLYGPAEVGAFVEMLFDHYLHWTRTQLLLNRQQTINQSDLLLFHHALRRLQQWTPIQHIIGTVDFCGCRLEVNPHVLIPRPETEQMVRWIIDEAMLPPDARMLDLCTGSGCIAIALAYYHSEAAVQAVDLSAEALATARRNAERNCVQVDFRQANLLQGFTAWTDAPYSLIVSNPPYVRQSERALMRPNVLDYEPSMALFVPDEDPLLFYRTIAQGASQWLARDGLLVVEINEDLASPTADLLRAHGLVPRLHKDYWERPRWISATRQ